VSGAQKRTGRRCADRGGGTMNVERMAEFPLMSRVNAYIAMTKPDVTLLVVMTTAAGYCMGARGPVDWVALVNAVLGTTLVAAGTAVLNHYIERDSDAHMRRTASRPLPSGAVQPIEALVFGV